MATFPRPCLVAAVDMQISQTAMNLAVVFELSSRKKEKLLERGLYCVQTNQVFSKAKSSL